MYGKTPWNKGLTKETSRILKHQGEAISEKIRKGDTDTSRIGKCLTEEGRKRLSEFQSKPKSESTKKKISQALKGRKVPKDIVEKTAMKLRGKKQEKVTCPHCGKSGGNTMHRWHFDNCKENND